MDKAALLPAQVVIDSRLCSVKTLIDSLSDKSIIIPMSYHWSQKEESMFIESILLRIPLGPIYVEEFDEGRFEVIEGVKRMNALQNIVLLNRPFCSLEYYTKYNDMPFDKMEHHHQRRVLETGIMIHSIKKSVPQAVKDNSVMRLQT